VLSRATRLAAIALGLSVCLCAWAALAGAKTADDPYPGYHSCGRVSGGHHFSISIYAKKLSCGRARRIDHEYYFGPEDRKRHHGPENYNGWWTLKRFPGWRCTEGTGGGGCRSHGREALFNTL
jgi:hypothetical protein